MNALNHLSFAKPTAIQRAIDDAMASLAKLREAPISRMITCEDDAEDMEALADLVEAYAIIADGPLRAVAADGGISGYRNAVSEDNAVTDLAYELRQAVKTEAPRVFFGGRRL